MYDIFHSHRRGKRVNYSLQIFILVSSRSLRVDSNMKYKTVIGDPSIERDQQELGKRTWPEFMQHDAVVESLWSHLYTDFIKCQFAIYSEQGIVGVGNSIPIHWTGEFSHLPNGGIRWAMTKAVNDKEKNRSPNLLVAIQILINPLLQSKGLSYEFLNEMKEIGRRHEFEYIALPVRPTQKHLFPTMSMEQYMEMTKPNGDPYDAWIRVHIKSGGRMVGICSESMIIEGSIDEWQVWTGKQFHRSGQYSVEMALSPVYIDLDKNLGVYTEPNVWIIHSTQSAAVGAS